MELAIVKSYLRITHELDDYYLSSLIRFSKEFIEQQTGVTYNSSDEVYNQAMLLCIAHFYDNRVAISDKNAIVVPFSLDCLIGHLKMRGSIADE